MTANDCGSFFDIFVSRLVSVSEVVRIINVLVCDFGRHACKENTATTTCPVNFDDQSLATSVWHRSFVKVMANAKEAYGDE
jgi:formylmethanofuran dehydrogenase subunit A